MCDLPVNLLELVVVVEGSSIPHIPEALVRKQHLQVHIQVGLLEVLPQRLVVPVVRHQQAQVFVPEFDVHLFVALGFVLEGVVDVVVHRYSLVGLDAAVGDEKRGQAEDVALLLAVELAHFALYEFGHPAGA